MQDLRIQCEYGAAVAAHYGLKDVVTVSMPTDKHNEALVINIGVMASTEDIKGIAARFAGEVPAKVPDRNRIVLLSLAHATEHQMVGAKVHVDQHEVEVRYSNLTREQLCQHPRVWREVPAQTGIGELTVKLDTSLVRDTIREMLEPGAMYLPASAVEKWAAHGIAMVEEAAGFGAIVAK